MPRGRSPRPRVLSDNDANVLPGCVPMCGTVLDAEDREFTLLQQEVDRILSRRELSNSAEGFRVRSRDAGANHTLHDAAPAALLPNLLIWRAPVDQQDVQMLMKLGVTDILNCAACDTGDVSTLLPPEIAVRGLRARDSAEYDMVGCHLLEAKTFIDDALSSPGAVVLVHCHHGHNRSAAIALAYIVHSRGIELLSILKRTSTLAEAFAKQLVRLAVICGQTLENFQKDARELVDPKLVDPTNLRPVLLGMHGRRCSSRAREAPARADGHRCCGRADLDDSEEVDRRRMRSPCSRRVDRRQLRVT